jgi:FkbM family methyltransferase
MCEGQRKMKRFKRRWLVAAAMLFLLVAVAAYLVRRPVAYVVLFQLGRSQACAWADIRQALSRGSSQAEIAASCHQLRKDAEGYELWETPKGDFWVPSENGEKLPYLLSNLERHIDRQGSCQVHSGDIVLDCGAHVGLFVREAIASGAGVIVAIEPAAENIACLRRNFPEEIRAGRVIVYPKGVWDKEEVLSFRIDPHFSGGDRVALGAQDDAQIQHLRVTTIDRLVTELGLARVDFIKLHVEGSEQQALAGARETIIKFRPRLAVAADHRDDDVERIPELVRAAWPGYRMSSGDCYVNRKRLLVLPDMLFFSK